MVQQPRSLEGLQQYKRSDACETVLFRHDTALPSSGIDADCQLVAFSGAAIICRCCNAARTQGMRHSLLQWIAMEEQSSSSKPHHCPLLPLRTALLPSSAAALQHLQMQ